MLVNKQNLTRFYYIQGNRFMPAALGVYKAKIVSQALYGVPVWIKIHLPFFGKSLVCIVMSFILFYVSKSSLIRLNTLALLRSMKFWLGVLFNMANDNLMYQLVSDSAPPCQITNLHN